MKLHKTKRFALAFFVLTCMLSAQHSIAQINQSVKLFAGSINISNGSGFSTNGSISNRIGLAYNIGGSIGFARFRITNVEDLTVNPKFTVNLYPNPVQTSLRIGGIDVNQAVYRYKIVDIKGQIVQTEIITNFLDDDFSIDVFNLKQGAYLLYIESAMEQVYCGKFIKNNL